MVAAAFPVLAETRQMLVQDVERLLSYVLPLSEDGLDVPGFLRRNSGRQRGDFR